RRARAIAPPPFRSTARRRAASPRVRLAWDEPRADAARASPRAQATTTRPSTPRAARDTRTACLYRRITAGRGLVLGARRGDIAADRGRRGRRLVRRPVIAGLHPHLFPARRRVLSDLRVDDRLVLGDVAHADDRALGADLGLDRVTRGGDVDVPTGHGRGARG